MRLFSLRSVRTVAIAAGCLFSTRCVLATPSIVDHELLSMVPGGTQVISGLRPGQPTSFLVMTRNNTADLTDFQSLTGADASRVIGQVVLIATSGPAGLLTEHALLANGHYDSHNIFKSALANGAARSQYLGLPVLVVSPMLRNRDVAPDVRWLIVIDNRIAVFGTIPSAQETLRRYLDRTSPDARLLWNLANLRSEDQSWSIVAVPSVRALEMVRRSLAPLDASLGDSFHAGNGLVLGIHFGRQVEAEYEDVPAELLQPPALDAPLGYTFRNEESPNYHMIKVSRQQYEKWIAGQTTLPGEAPPHPEQQLARQKRIR